MTPGVVIQRLFQSSKMLEKLRGILAQRGRGVIVVLVVLQGYTTYIMKQERMELRSTAYMWRVIENCLSAKIKPEIKGMTMSQDRYVCIATFLSDSYPSGCI